MLFDDRLGTVLRQRPGGVNAAKTQFRQLLDLLGTLPSEASGEAIDAAYLRLAELGTQLESADKVEMVSDPGLRLRSPRLVALLASDDARLAAATIRTARLADREWLDLIPALPVPARQFLRLRDDLGPEALGLLGALGIHDAALPSAETSAEQRIAAAEAAVRSEGALGIAALVKRIEAFRKARVPVEAANDGQAPRLPLGEDAFLLRAAREVRAFDFACDAEGRIVWADPGVAPMVVGLSLTNGDDAGSRTLARAIRRLQPLRAVHRTLSGASAITGTWQIDAAPWFDRAGGRLAGWLGRFRRLPETTASPASAVSDEADRIRQLLHELKTPVNAIQGYAEAMQQGLFGPIGHEYRAMSADIASDAARILASFEELERLARLDSGAMVLEPGLCDIGDIAVATAARLRPHTFARRIFFDVQLGEGPLTVPIAPLEAERLLWRLFATLAAAATPGERLRLRLRRRGDHVRLRMQLPATLAERSDEELFRATPPTNAGALSPGNFGGGFALRLAASEAKAGGGELVRRGDKLRLSLAGLTEPAMLHSHRSELVGSRKAVPD